MEKHAREQRFGLGGLVDGEAGANEDRHGVPIGSHVRIDHRLVGLERLVFVLELFAFLEKHVVEHDVGGEAATLHLLHHQGGQRKGVAGLENAGVVADIQLVGQREKLHHLGGNVATLSLVCNDSVEETLFLASQIGWIGMYTSLLGRLMRLFERGDIFRSILDSSRSLIIDNKHTES